MTRAARPGQYIPCVPFVSLRALADSRLASGGSSVSALSSSSLAPRTMHFSASAVSVCSRATLHPAMANHSFVWFATGRHARVVINFLFNHRAFRGSRIRWLPTRLAFNRGLGYRLCRRLCASDCVLCCPLSLCPPPILAIPSRRSRTVRFALNFFSCCTAHRLELHLAFTTGRLVWSRDCRHHSRVNMKSLIVIIRAVD